MVTCWLNVSVWVLDAAVVSALTGWLVTSLAGSAFLTASHSAETENDETHPILCLDLGV